MAPCATPQQQPNGSTARSLQFPQAPRRLAGAFASRSSSQLASCSCNPSPLIGHLCTGLHCLPLLLGPRTWSSINNVHHVDNNFQRCLAAKQHSQEEEESGSTPKMYGSNFELGRCFLSFSLHVVKTVSVAMSCLYVSRECSPCKSLMHLICLKVVIHYPCHMEGGSPPLSTSR